ncbi:hypothetical protein KCMC57_up00020 [Kitasatospora sp. CMC57]|uniref:Uncharacterized protein n=1 Tax=Kitasatospora sp. CMC57 TaxID=3231513 RepID=A0AB33K4N6_9ACTN
MTQYRVNGVVTFLSGDASHAAYARVRDDIELFTGRVRELSIRLEALESQLRSTKGSARRPLRQEAGATRQALQMTRKQVAKARGKLSSIQRARMIAAKQRPVQEKPHQTSAIFPPSSDPLHELEREHYDGKAGGQHGAVSGPTIPG